MAVSATLNQNGRLVAFYSRSLNKSELAQSSIEKRQQLFLRPSESEAIS